MRARIVELFLDVTTCALRKKRCPHQALGASLIRCRVRVEFSLTTLLEYRDYMHEWSQHLSELCEYDTDSVICLLIESRRIQDVVHAQTSNRTQPSSASSGDGDRMLESYNFWVAKCEDWNRQHGHHEQTRCEYCVRVAPRLSIMLISQQCSICCDMLLSRNCTRP